MSLPNVKLKPNNVSRSSSDLPALIGKSNTFLDAYIYMKNTKYNALYEKNKEILIIENMGIKNENPEYLYDAFMEHVRILDSAIVKMRNFAFRIKNDVLENLQAIIPNSTDIDKFQTAIIGTTDMPKFKYIHYHIKSIEYADITILNNLFDHELKVLTNNVGTAGQMPITRVSNFLEGIMNEYKTSYDGLLDMEEFKVMTPSRRNVIVRFFRQKGKIISSVNKDFRTYHFFLRQFNDIYKMAEKLKPTTMKNGHVMINGDEISFTDYVTIYKHFSTIMKDLLDIVGLYDNLFYNKIYALQSNIEVYNSIIKYTIEYYNAKQNGDPLNETTLVEAWWDGYLNSDEIDAHNLINGNNAAQELLWDDASESEDTDDDDDEYYEDDDDFVKSIENEKEPLEENITVEKIGSSIKGKYLSILSYIKDIYRKWQGIETVPASKEEKELLDKIIDESRSLIDSLLEILKTGKNISYETKYESFVDHVNEFKKAHKKKEKTDTVSINSLHEEVKKLERALHESTKSKIEYAAKYRSALWVVISRTLYVINVLLYNASGKGQGKATNKIKKEGIASKRYGKEALGGIALKKLDDSDLTPLLNKLRTTSSYGAYKKVFDEVCEITNKKDISAIKLLDLTNHDKLIFVAYKQLKPMILKAGTKLYHISIAPSFTVLEPRFKSKDNITFYSKPRIYFTDKFVNPKKVLPNVPNPNIYEYTVTSDTVAYRDSEYGAWYHNCVYIEKDSPVKVKNVTDEFISKDENKSKLSESVEWQDYFDLKVLNETISNTFDTVKDNINESDKHTIGCTESELNKLKNDFDKLSDNEKVKKVPVIINILKKVMSTLSYVIGIGLVNDSIHAYKEDKEFMKDIKKEMPMNHETYNKIYNAIFFKSVLRIIASILITIASITFITFSISKTSANDIKSIAKNAGTIAKRIPSLSDVCGRIISTTSKLLAFGSMSEACDIVDVYDGEAYIDDFEDSIGQRKLTDNELDTVENDLPLKEEMTWLQNTGEEAGPICTIRSSIMI